MENAVFFVFISPDRQLSRDFLSEAVTVGVPSIRNSSRFAAGR